MTHAESVTMGSKGLNPNVLTRVSAGQSGILRAFVAFDIAARATPVGVFSVHYTQSC
jgi:hypothetical protein